MYTLTSHNYKVDIVYYYFRGNSKKNTNTVELEFVVGLYRVDSNLSIAKHSNVQKPTTTNKMHNKQSNNHLLGW